MTLDGPFPIHDLSQPTTDGEGVTTYPLAPGEHYKTEPDTLAAFADLLTPYVVSPPVLQNVWAGDPPDAYTLTVPLRFPDAATAEAVRLAILGPPAEA